MSIFVERVGVAAGCKQPEINQYSGYTLTDGELYAIKDQSVTVSPQLKQQFIETKLQKLDISRNQSGVDPKYEKLLKQNVSKTIDNTEIRHSVRNLTDFAHLSAKNIAIIRCFRESLPKRPYCANNIKFGLIRGWNNCHYTNHSGAAALRPVRHSHRPIARVERKRSLIATDYALIQFNPEHARRWLAFDLDYNVKALGTQLARQAKLPNPSRWWPWKVKGLPAPSLVMINPTNGHAHVLYGLETPVFYGDKARPKPIAYCENIAQALRTALKADMTYTGLICKNPFSSAWQVFFPSGSRLYDLDTLRKELINAGVHVQHYSQIVCRLSSKRSLQKWLDDYGFVGRNWYLFQRLRLECYPLIGNWTGSREAWDQKVATWANFSHQDMCTQFHTRALPTKEITQIAANVSNWIWENRTKLANLRRSQDEGILEFGPNRGNYNFSVPYRSAVVAAQHCRAGGSFTAGLSNVQRDQQGYAAMNAWAKQWLSAHAGASLAQFGTALYAAKPEIAALLGYKSWPKRLITLLCDSVVLAALYEQKPLPADYFGNATIVANMVLKKLRRTTDKRHQVRE